MLCHCYTRHSTAISQSGREKGSGEHGHSPRPAAGHLPGDGARLGSGSMGGPGWVGPMGVQGRAVGSWGTALLQPCWGCPGPCMYSWSFVDVFMENPVMGTTTQGDNFFFIFIPRNHQRTLDWWKINSRPEIWKSETISAPFRNKHEEGNASSTYHIFVILGKDLLDSRLYM